MGSSGAWSIGSSGAMGVPPLPWTSGHLMRVRAPVETVEDSLDGLLGHVEHVADLAFGVSSSPQSDHHLVTVVLHDVFQGVQHLVPGLDHTSRVAGGAYGLVRDGGWGVLAWSVRLVVLARSAQGGAVGDQPVDGR